MSFFASLKHLRFAGLFLLVSIMGVGNMYLAKDFTREKPIGRVLTCFKPSLRLGIIVWLGLFLVGCGYSTDSSIDRSPSISSSNESTAVNKSDFNEDEKESKNDEDDDEQSSKKDDSEEKESSEYYVKSEESYSFEKRDSLTSVSDNYEPQIEDSNPAESVSLVTKVIERDLNDEIDEDKSIEREPSEEELSLSSNENDKSQFEDNISSDSISLIIKETEWDDDDQKLKVKGLAEPKQQLTISDADTFVVIATVLVESDGEWELKVKNLEFAPCSIRVEATNTIVTSLVEDAPDNCGISDEESGDVVTPTPVPVKKNTQLLAFNDLGMHCMDEDYSVFSVLPPFNVLHAQVIQKGTASQKPQILTASQVDVQYNAVADPNGSINSTSIGKTNFWDYVQDLFGMSPAPDSGLLGLSMPSAENGAQDFPDYDANHEMFTAAGIPITPIDDAGVYNPYPLLQVSATDKTSGTVLSTLDVTVPVSTEMNCFDCHYTGNIAADEATALKYSTSPIVWSDNNDLVIEYKENILILHDVKHNTSLVNNQPVLCADCHYSPALDLAGAGPQGQQVGISYMSRAVHGRHGMNIDGGMPDTTNPAIISDAGKEACYDCHPGKQTQCFRGAMFSAGLSCQSCHGGLLAVAGEFPLADGSVRQPWIDLPQCQSCHTGDATDHMGNSLILDSAYVNGDQSAEPIIATNKRFAEQDNTLYRNSKGHGGIACEGCHGSTHAIWPVNSVTTNDNLAAIQLQGHAGFISECSVCHEENSLPLTLDGPHGMHNVGDSRWNEDHESFYERNPEACKACHGLDLKGTVLAKLSIDRVLKSDDEQTDGSKNITLAKGTEVACDLCHEMP